MYSIWKILWMHRNILRCFSFLSFPDHLLTHVILRSGYLAYINSFIVHILLRCSKGLGLNILLISRERGNLTCRMGLDNFQEETSVTHCFFVCSCEFMGIYTTASAFQPLALLCLDLQGVFFT